MALVVEDGTGLATAESYISAADAVTYATNIYGASDTFVVASLTVQEIALRRAAQTLDAIYSERWKGIRIKGGQGLDWPRSSIFDDDGFAVASNSVPQGVQRAQVELARRLNAGTDPLSDEKRGGAVRRQTVGPISIEYMDRASAGVEIPVVERLLADFIAGSEAIAMVARA